jgi:predicted dienelactone hydrolase
MKIHWALSWTVWMGMTLSGACAWAQSTPAAAGPFAVGFRNVSFSEQGLANNPIGARVYYPAVSAGQNVTVATGQFPVLSFGHGFNLNYLDYTQIFQHLASWGYFVVTPNTQNGFSVNHLEFARELGACIRYVLNESANPASPFFGKALNVKGTIGHSMGGGASFLTPSVYPEVDAIAGLAAAETNPSAIQALASVNKPFLVISGTSDNTTPPDEHQIPMYNAVQGPKIHVSLNGGSHCKFTDGSTICDLVSSPGTISRAKQIYFSRKYLTAFFNYYLKNQVSMRAFLCGDSIAADQTANHLTRTTNITFVPVLHPQNPTVCGDAQIALSSADGKSYTWAPAAGLSATTGETVFASPSQTTVYTLTVNSFGCVAGRTFTVSVVSSPTLTASGSTIYDVPTGTITAVAAGGLPPYEYSLDGQTFQASSTFGGLDEGTYSVTVRDANGCTATASANVTRDPARVWPGDANDDGRCDVFDFYYTAANYLQSGNPRAGGGVLWQAYFAPAPWNLSGNFQTQNVNLRFCDANGDGVVNLLDMAVTLVHRGRVR